MNAWKRCALLEGHGSLHAAWAHLSDTAEPREGKRCGFLVEPRVEHWQRVVTGKELANEKHRRDVIVWCRIVAARHGYRGRVSFVRLNIDGPRDTRLYAIRVQPALGGP